MKGKLIVFEGGEGSGKTTQLARSLQLPIFQQLIERGAISRLVETKEPGGTKLGNRIRELLLNSTEPIDDVAELLLYAADRAQHVNTFLKPMLEEGAVVLCDRFTASTIAYQGYGRGLNLELIKHLNGIATNGLKPDMTFWFNGDPPEGLKRASHKGRHDRIEQETIDFHRRVWDGYWVQFVENKDWTWIDANQSEEEVTIAVQDALTKALIEWYGEGDKQGA